MQRLKPGFVMRRLHHDLRSHHKFIIARALSSHGRSKTAAHAQPSHTRAKGPRTPPPQSARSWREGKAVQELSTVVSADGSLPAQDVLIQVNCLHWQGMAGLHGSSSVSSGGGSGLLCVFGVKQRTRASVNSVPSSSYLCFRSLHPPQHDSRFVGMGLCLSSARRALS